MTFLCHADLKSFVKLFGRPNIFSNYIQRKVTAASGKWKEKNVSVPTGQRAPYNTSFPIGEKVICNFLQKPMPDINYFTAKHTWNGRLGEETSEFLLQISTFGYTYQQQKTPKPKPPGPADIKTFIRLRTTSKAQNIADKRKVVNGFRYFTDSLRLTAEQLLYLLRSPQYQDYIRVVKEKHGYSGDGGNGSTTESSEKDVADKPPPAKKGRKGKKSTAVAAATSAAGNEPVPGPSSGVTGEQLIETLREDEIFHTEETSPVPSDLGEDF